MAVDPNIKKKANDIRNKIYGKEVRESLASGLEAMSSDVIENESRQSVVEGRQDGVESQWQVVSDEMTDKDVISAPEIIAARNGESNLKARLDKENQEVTAQLAHIANEGTSCSSLGLIPNDESKAVENLTLLTDALIEGKKILVDDIYYINQINERRFIQNTVFSLKGVTPNAELKTTIRADYALFNLSGNSKVFVENITFNGVTDDPIPLFSTDTLSYFDKVYIEKCTFNGLLAGSFLTSTEIDILTQQVGIGELVFRENRANDIKASFLNLNNTPITKIVINDNVINNFCRIFINGTLANESPNLKELEKSRRYMEVKNNLVTCDDDWFDDTPTWSYHCFILWEGDGIILYDNNHVEGLKSRKDVPVYDVYFVGNRLFHTNSVWKNNLCFNSNKVSTTSSLLKSKGAGENGTRLYEGNTYIVEKEFVERIGESLENSWVYFMDLNSPIKNYDIKNNKFYVHEIRFRAPVRQVGFNITNFSIENNVFKVYKSEGVLMSVDYFEGFDYSNGTHKISNNDFLIETGVFRLLSQDFRGDTRPKNKSIVINNNRYQGEKITLYSPVVSTEKLVVTNNNILLTTEDDNIFTNGETLVGEVLSENNNIKTSGGSIHRLGELGLKVQTNDKFTGRLYTDLSNRTGMFFRERGSVKNHKYIVEMKLLFPEGWQKMNYEFVYGYDETLEQNYIEFKDTSDEIVRRMIGDRGNNPIKVNNETEIVHAKPYYSGYSVGTTVTVASPVSPIMYEEKVISFEI